jgi:pSer/pThr/pTyr-binding forkhead associated (FHA) protein
MPKLVVLTIGLNDRSFEVKPEKSIIGRLDDNPLSLPEPSVSSRHCEVFAKGDDIVVRDLGSTNGTFINERQLEAGKDVTLRPGQVLRLGQVELKYETGKKQTDQPRTTVKLGESSSGQTVVISKNSAFAKKDNKAVKIFWAIGIILVLAIVVFLYFAFSGVGAGQ